jgi:hypothetical protein
MELFYSVDRVMGGYMPNLPESEVEELLTQMNCNLYDSEDNELWFDQDNPPEMIDVISEGEFWEREFEHI